MSGVPDRESERAIRPARSGLDVSVRVPGSKSITNRALLLAALAGGADFNAALSAMTAAAEMGWKSTKDLQARLGRAARLGERSIGVLDAGATSCFLLLKTLGGSLQRNLTTRPA